MKKIKTKGGTTITSFTKKERRKMKEQGFKFPSKERYYIRKKKK